MSLCYFLSVGLLESGKIGECFWDTWFPAAGSVGAGSCSWWLLVGARTTPCASGTPLEARCPRASPQVPRVRPAEDSPAASEG